MRALVAYVLPFCVLPLSLSFVGCAEAPAPWTDAWMLSEGQRYLTEPDARREGLLDSLESQENIYARERMANYGLGGTGWDTLPAWNPRSVPVSSEVAGRISRGEPVDVDVAPLWDGVTPQTMQAWIALGREVFFRYPLRADPYIAHALQTGVPDLGISRDAEGGRPGVLVFRDLDGETALGLSCALCHTAADGDELLIGAARRELDYGAMRLAYHDDTGVPVSDELRARLATWGPGRADITADETADPVAIPDLYGLREQSSLTQAGTIRHTGPIALAIRQETQYLHANHQRSRPPRELMLALTFFLYSLEAPAPEPSSEAADRGAMTFDSMCASCHSNGAYGGALVRAGAVGTDPALAMGAARGTGRYRTPSLLGVAAAAPYLHDGTVPTLDALLGRSRLSDTYEDGAHGPGAVPGHEYGTYLAASERSDLIAFLRTL